MLRICLTTLLLLLDAAHAYAAEKGYKVVKPDGSVEFTDRPTAGAQQIPLPNAQSYEAPALPSLEQPASPSKTVATPAATIYTKLAITTPTADQRVAIDDAGFPITVELEPALAQGDTLVVMFDGTVVANGAGPTFTLHELVPGPHTITVEVHGADGSTVMASPAVTFFLFHHSLLPAPPAPPTPPPSQTH